MKNLIFLRFISVVFCLLLVIFYSCNKDEMIDNSDMFVYTSSGNSTYNISTGELLKTLDSSEMTKGLSIGVTITRPSNVDVIVKGEIDTTLIKEYDLLKNTISTRYDLSKFDLSKSEIVIPAGALHSADNFTILLKDTQLDITSPCVIPIRIKSNGNVPTSNKRKVMFLVITGQKKIMTSFTTVLDRINSSYSPSNDVYPKVGFPINLNVGLSKAIKVSVVYDKALVDDYNEKNGTSFFKVPDGSFQLSSSQVNIKEQSLLSSDSVKIQFPDRSKFELGKEYLIPIKISNAESAFISETNGVKYIVFKPFVNNIDPSNKAFTESNLDRTGWVATAGQVYTESYSAQNVLDGNHSTSWFSFITPNSFVNLDMGSTKKVNGFSIIPNYGAFSLIYDFRSIEVFTSENGTFWISQGVYVGSATLNSSNVGNPDIKTIRFISPVSSRYFKFQVLTGSNLYTGIGEIYAK